MSFDSHFNFISHIDEVAREEILMNILTSRHETVNTSDSITDNNSFFNFSKQYLLRSKKSERKKLAINSIKLWLVSVFVVRERKRERWKQTMKALEKVWLDDKKNWPFKIIYLWFSIL